MQSLSPFSRLSLATVAAAALSTAAFAAPAQAAAKPKPKSVPRHEQMEYGPFLSHTIGELPGGRNNDAGPKGNNAHKGIAIRLNPEGTAGVCFDTDLCRMTAGWTGGFLHLRGTAFDTSHGSWPAAKGDVLFRTTQGVPGWARPGTEDDFKDPRPEPYGPLPREWAKYRGLYVHGDKVVLSYTVGESSVLETATCVRAGNEVGFDRMFNISPGKDLTLFLAEKRLATTARGDKGTVGFLQDSPRGHLLHIKASDKPRRVSVRVSTYFERDGMSMLPELAAPEDLTAYTKGGPAKYAQTIETKGVLGTPKTPADAYVVDTLTLPDENPWKSWLRVGGMDFFADGKRAALSTWSGDVWVVSGIEGDLSKLTWKRFATGLYQPLGLRIVNDVVYVNGRDQITRLHDLNGDGEADFHENFNNDHTTTTAFHEFVFDLQTDKEGNFYYGHAGGVNPGGRGFQPNPPASQHGCVLKVSKDGSKTEIWATGFRAPNGIGVGPDGTVTAGDNEGTWMPACRISWVEKGSFQGCVSMAHRTPAPTTYDPPICWLPKNIDNSGGGQCWVTSDRWGLPAGTLLHTSYGTSSLYNVLLDNSAGVVQGGVVRVPVQFLTGVMRPRFNPADGQLYVVGLKGWQTNGARDGAFHRVRYTGKPVHTVSGLKATKTGLELTFTGALDSAAAADADNYGIEVWNYLWTSNYGSPEVKPSDPKQKGHETFTVKAVKVSADGRTVTLEIPDIKPVMQFRINIRGKAADGAALRLDVYGTINKLPG